MNFGHFDQPNREYVITRPDTPRPWSNYIGSAQFGGLVTNHAAGYAFYKSADQGRLTRYRFNATPGDLCGRYVYVRDQDNADYWANSWLPVRKPLDRFDYECRHGTGYTRIRSTYAGITSRVTYLTPLGATHEVWGIAVKNTDTRPRRLSVFPFLEPQCNWSATDDVKNLQYTQYITETRYLGNLIDIGSNVNMPEDPERFTNKDQKRHTFFLLAGAEATAFDADLDAFLGTYGTYAAPHAVVSGQCSNRVIAGDMPCAAFQINLDLQPGEERWFACVFGVGRDETIIRALAPRFATEAGFEATLREIQDYWQAKLGTLRVETPEPLLDPMANLWSPYNNLMTFYWSRTASLVYAGERDGLGYRDTVQDIVGASALVPDEAGPRLELMLSGQYAHGGAKPVVQPFNHHPGKEAFPDHYRSDDCMWLFNAVPAYVKETGRLDFYHQVIPYADQGQAPVWQHLRRAIEFNLTNSGQHGLPCGLYADWNDCLRLGERGETVFVAMQLRYALAEYIAITTRLALTDETRWAEAELAALDQRIATHAWDGQWYLRAIREDGFKFGSRENDEGRIFMNPQAWAVLSGHATGERATLAMESLHRELATDYGIMLCTPPYVHTDPQVCLGRLMNPGSKENGGIFNHTQGWAVMAAAKLGQGNRAWDYLRRVLPGSFNDIAEIRQVEPYAVCQSTFSRFSPRNGSGRVSWLSGSAVWNYVALTHAILGLQPDYDGLVIAPCIPDSWPSYRVERRFRGALYHITVLNPHGLQTGTVHLVVNGEPIPGNCLPLAPSGTTVQVQATLA